MLRTFRLNNDWEKCQHVQARCLQRSYLFEARHSEMSELICDAGRAGTRVREFKYFSLRNKVARMKMLYTNVKLQSIWIARLLLK